MARVTVLGGTGYGGSAVVRERRDVGTRWWHSVAPDRRSPCPVSHT